MKYFSLVQIKEALRRLQPHHPILASTFFTMKKANAPIGEKAHFSLDNLNEEFLQKHYRVHPKSAYSLRVMRQGTPLSKNWNDPGYAGKGLQSVNTRGCPDAFLHDRNENTWGWAKDYVKALAKKLPRGKKVPLFHMAVWFYKQEGWPDSTTQMDVLSRLIKEYRITDDELDLLFDTSISSDIPESEAFQSFPVQWTEILSGITPPDDVPPESSGVLTFLEIDSVGPLLNIKFEPAPRLNIITGDNGLGKTAILDLSWWALTRNWAENAAWPNLTTGRIPTIKYAISASHRREPLKATFNKMKGEWICPVRTPAVSGLVVYARVDGSFAIWDPANQTLQRGAEHSWPGAQFRREEVWNGKPGQIEGLIRDWVKWQERQDKYPAFELFTAILRRVSPPDLGPLKPGDPQRIPGEIRDMPTIEHPYGTTPIIFTSAGIKRIVTLAYLIVWAWVEHKLQAKQTGRKEENQMVVIVDEVEAHLHPKWQRVILPAFMGIAGDLSPELSMQLLVATHSPLVLASSEPVFDTAKDRLFHFDMSMSGAIRLVEVPFELRGSSDSWLKSEVFNVKHPGSPQREDAIREALALQHLAEPEPERIAEITTRLKEYLAAEDPFWVRWVLFAQTHGVEV